MRDDVQAGLGMSGSGQSMARLKWKNGATGIVGVHLTIRSTGRKANRQQGLRRTYIRVAARDIMGDMICQYFMVGNHLDSHHAVHGSTSLVEAWDLATAAYFEHMGVARPSLWLRVENTPKVRQFTALQKEMERAGIKLTIVEQSLIKSIKQN